MTHQLYQEFLILGASQQENYVLKMKIERDKALKSALAWKKAAKHYRLRLKEEQK